MTQNIVHPLPDDNLNIAKIEQFFFDRKENIMGKGKKTLVTSIFSFSQLCFLKVIFERVVKCWHCAVKCKERLVNPDPAITTENRSETAFSVHFYPNTGPPIPTSSPFWILRLVIMIILLSLSISTTSATQFGSQEWLI